MRETFSKILGFLPLAIIIGIQVLAVIRKRAAAEKKAAEKKQGIPGSRAQTITAKAKKPESVSWGHWETARDEKPKAKTMPQTPSPVKSAHLNRAAQTKVSEPVIRGHWETDEDEKTKQSPPGKNKPQISKKLQDKTLSHKISTDDEMFSARQTAASFSASAALPATLPGFIEAPFATTPAAMYAEKSVPAAVPGTEAISRAAQSSPARPLTVITGNFPQCLDYLPPLKRAIAMAEILGPPKGLI